MSLNIDDQINLKLSLLQANKLINNKDLIFEIGKIKSAINKTKNLVVPNFEHEVSFSFSGVFLESPDHKETIDYIVKSLEYKLQIHLNDLKKLGIELYE